LGEDGGWAGKGSFGGSTGEQNETDVGGGEVGVGEAGSGGGKAEVGYRSVGVRVTAFEDAGGFFDGGGGAASASFEVSVGDDAGWEVVAEGSEVRHGVLLWCISIRC
jgi:hypothetical protein